MVEMKSNRYIKKMIINFLYKSSLAMSIVFLLPSVYLNMSKMISGDTILTVQEGSFSSNNFLTMPKGLIEIYDEEIAKKAKRKILIQINRANHRSKLISKTHEYIKSINISATKTLIGHRQIFIASMGEGKTVVEKQRKSKAVEEIRKISEQILLELK